MLNATLTTMGPNGIKSFKIVAIRPEIEAKCPFCGQTPKTKWGQGENWIATEYCEHLTATGGAYNFPREIFEDARSWDGKGEHPWPWRSAAMIGPYFFFSKYQNTPEGRWICERTEVPTAIKEALDKVSKGIKLWITNQYLYWESNQIIAKVAQELGLETIIENNQVYIVCK